MLKLNLCNRACRQSIVKLGQYPSQTKLVDIARQPYTNRQVAALIKLIRFYPLWRKKDYLILKKVRFRLWVALSMTHLLF